MTCWPRPNPWYKTSWEEILANTFLAEIITPEKVLFRALAEEVTLRTEDGDITFLANHADYLAAADITPVRIQVSNEANVAEWINAYATEPGNRAQKSPLVGVNREDLHASDSLSVYAAVHGGFVHVTEEGVRIYSPVAELATALDRDRVEAVLDGLPVGADTFSDPVDEDEKINPSLVSLLSTSPVARAILLPGAYESRQRRAEVRLAVLNAAGQF